jgi:hypothetical protein
MPQGFFDAAQVAGTIIDQSNHQEKLEQKTLKDNVIPAKDI